MQAMYQADVFFSIMGLFDIKKCRVMPDWWIDFRSTSINYVIAKK